MALRAGIVLASFATPAGSVEFIKCNAIEGKTLYASFGKIVHSGGPEPIYYPIEFVVFSEPQKLQERIIYPNTKASLAVAVSASAAAVKFAFRSVLSDGTSETERFDLHRYSSRSPTGFIGIWKTDAPGHHAEVSVFCSVY
jgi:hypothetical protein